MNRPPRRLDLETWSRRDHFAFFKDYELPFFGVCADVDVGSTLRRCRRPGGPSFFLATIHASLAAANAVDEFRYRIRGDEVVEHDVLHAGSTVLVPDERFAFAYFTWDPDFDRFARAATEVLESLPREGRILDPRDDRDDLLHYTVVPWISFTGFLHARRLRPHDSVPKIAFGRYHGERGEERMPVAVDAHHALMDALHVARFLERFQSLLEAFGAEKVEV